MFSRYFSKDRLLRTHFNVFGLQVVIKCIVQIFLNVWHEINIFNCYVKLVSYVVQMYHKSCKELR